MSELDDAIREHLELKRRHGARDAELQELEDEAFGTGERPLDPFKAGAEALVSDGEEADKPSEDAKAELDLDAEAPPAAPEAPKEEREPGAGGDEPFADAPEAGLEAADDAPPPPPAPDMPIPPPPPQPDRASEVVHQPTEEHPPPEPPSEELPEAELPAEEPLPEPSLSEPRFDDEEETAGEPEGGAGGPALFDFEAEAGAEPPPSAAPPAEPEEDFTEREPLPDPDDAFADLGPAESGGGASELPLEVDDLPSEEALSHDAEGDEEGPGAVTADTAEREALDLEPTEQYSLPAEDEPAPPFEGEETGSGAAPAPAPEEGEDDKDESLLEETPDFLEETPEGEEDLWFEKKPPKDFDFGDD